MSSSAQAVYKSIPKEGVFLCFFIDCETSVDSLD